MLEFLDKPHETRCVIIDGKGLEAVKNMPNTLKKNSKSFFFLKLMNEKITPENIDSLVRAAARRPLSTIARRGDGYRPSYSHRLLVCHR